MAWRTRHPFAARAYKIRPISLASAPRMTCTIAHRRPPFRTVALARNARISSFGLLRQNEQHCFPLPS